MMKMPLVLSNRSIFTTFYHEERADGWKCFFHSSKGNDHLPEEHKSAVGKDEVGYADIGYFQWRPYDGGMEIWCALKMDPRGMIPDMIKKKIGKRMKN
mmetsp:Transcript_6875/g.8193  ORF Transcript_6875/g.8193 Transcript_6875/m.8193 type:complete len:98 (+) Transcript_6875:345-638(+)|eukprot:CAMPEP_0170467678 /NCGR_PEP_ID=MMETSP0123-20130129/11175_1 /TAXON_ID=182087 /ORGANISM="Favella ehrenbergii, Strain Fehren 1" /LENGTH=97 /DNA_ID=CAMNT_0010734121 /DNA_START=324 /DNA_END=617 /DNA_ORIENTATION=+